MSTLDVVGFLLNLLVIIYIINKLIASKIKVKKIVFIWLTIVLFFLCLFSYFYSGNYTRAFINVLLFSVYTYFMYKVSMKESLVAAFFAEIIMVVSEMIFTLLIMVIFNFDIEFILNNVKGNFITNCIIDLIAIMLINNKKTFYLIYKLENYIFNSKVSSKKIFAYVLFMTITLNILLILPYFMKAINIFLITITFTFIYCTILYYALNEKNENIKFKIENEALMKNLNDYEKMLDYQRVSNHENKNQLLVIKSMAEKKDKKLIEYVSEIIHDKREDNEELYSKAKKLPTGGLQGLIYQKMLVMEENKIKIFLNISKEIKKLNFSNINSKMNYDLCRIVGILLDNAIDESKKLVKKEININLYFDEYFIIEVSNYFLGSIDLEKIYDKGYSTKGSDHGYGLSLVKEIISAEDNIINENKINNDIFTQIVKIKM